MSSSWVESSKSWPSELIINFVIIDYVAIRPPGEGAAESPRDVVLSKAAKSSSSSTP
jgi:hypothetical protein